jgi:ABC-type glycerol-3-phosphate transport system substrate-binding protein
LIRRRLTLHLLSALALLVLTAPALASKGGPKAEKEIKFWHTVGTHNKDILNQTIKAFNEENQSEPVVSVFQGSSRDLLRKLLSQENLPDVIQVPVQALEQLHAQGLITDLTPLVSDALKKDISHKYWQSVSIDERIYGIPFEYSVPLLYVNQHILRISGVKQEFRPKSWDDLHSIAQKIKKYSRKKWALHIPVSTVPQFLSFIRSYTGTPVVREGKFSINTEEAVSAMRFLQNLVFQEKIMPAKVTADEVEALFLSGNLGIMLNSSSMLVYIESNLPYDMNVWHLPSENDLPPVVTGSCLALVRSNAKHEKHVFSFVEYMVDYARAIKWHTHTGSPAIRTSVKESLDLLIFYEDNPNHMSSVIELERGRIYDPEWYFLDMDSIIENALDEILIKGEDPQKILFEAQKKIDAIVQAKNEQ